MMRLKGGYDLTTALAVMFAEWRTLPPDLCLVDPFQELTLRLRAVKTNWGYVHCTFFHMAGLGLRLQFGLGNSHFTTTEGAILKAAPVRCFSTGLVFEPEVNEILRRRPPGLYPLPAFVRTTTPSNPASLVDIATNAPAVKARPVVTDFQWPKGMRFEYSAHGLSVLKVKDGLAEAVLRILSGGEPSFHQGVFNTTRITEHQLTALHIPSRL